MTKRRHLSASYGEVRLAADLFKIQNLLHTAVEDYETSFGRVNAVRMPHHWTVQARKTLGLTDGETGMPGGKE